MDEPFCCSSLDLTSPHSPWTLTQPQKSCQLTGRSEWGFLIHKLQIIFAEHLAFSTEMSNNLRHYLPRSWNPTEAGPSLAKAMCSEEHGLVSQDCIWYSQEIENCGCLDPITKQLTRNFRWLLTSNKTPEHAALWLDHEWAVRDTALRDVNLRQSVCHLSLSWPQRAKKEGVPDPQSGIRGQFCPLLQGTKITDGKRWVWGGKERRERGTA